MNNNLLAQITNPVINIPGSEAQAADKAKSGVLLAEYIAVFWRTLIMLGGLATLLMLLWGALDWITAGGDEGKIKSARQKITQSIIGITILAGSVAIVEFVGSLIGFSLLELSFPTPDTLTTPPVPTP